MEKLNLAKSDKLFSESQKLVPGGVLGIRRPYNFVPGEYPIFFDKARGGKVTDVDGNEYIDMLCGYGPIIIGHREKEIDDAAIEQVRKKGFCMSLTQGIQNELAKKMQDLIPSCDKSIFLKTGSDATTAAVRIARGYTQKTKILRCGYHGWHDWCVEVKEGIPEKLYEDVFEFEYNNLEQVETLVKENKNEVAAIVVTPVGHPLAAKVQMPNPDFLKGLRDITNDSGSLLIFDEVRTGFRVNMGGAQKEFGVTPDLSVFGKAMGNGYPISCVVGKKEFMDIVENKVYVSSTFFPNSMEMAASLKTIDFMERNNVIENIRTKGQKFGKDVNQIVEDSKIPCSFTGSPWMPYITFDRDSEKKYKQNRIDFYTNLVRRKVFLQPYHHGYIAYRHEKSDLNHASDMISESLGSI